MSVKAKEIIAQMSLEEKSQILSGKNFWEIKGFEHLGLKTHMLTDGPHGLRKQTGGSDHLGINNSEPATSFPTAATTACSFDPELLKEMGESLGDKCIREDVAVILGPGVNIKRSPLCGRNFEYFSEDPYLAGEVATGLVKGIQSKGVGTSLKHFAANSQEFARMVNDSVVDERALREIYFPAFEATVKNAQPWTVMCSYNKINGTYASNNKWLLTDVLRDEWGYEGLVVTDWGAMDDPAKGVLAGCDLEMPFSGESNAKKIVKAYNDGIISMEDIDKCVERVIDMYLKAQEPKASCRTEEEDNELARKIASESMVLLKNEGALPVSDEEEILVIGEMAEKSRYQGAGSSKINPSFLDSLVKALKDNNKKFRYRQGYKLGTEEIDEGLLSDAINAAKGAEKVIIVAGLPDEYESEGFDRANMSMPESHLRLINEICKVNDKVVVVLQCGAAIELPWKEEAEGILLTYLSGQAGGSATLDVLYGKVNPSGKLAETWPVKVSDNPSYRYYPGTIKQVLYKESIFVGYRYYDTVGAPVNYPFGFGLSYTDFEYSNLKVIKKADAEFEVSVDITNTGERFGKEVVELYIAKKESKIIRAAHELKGFAKVALEPGEKKTVTILLNKEAFRYYNAEANCFAYEGGSYEIQIAKSSRNVLLTETVSIEGDGKEQLLVEVTKGLTEYKLLSFPLKISDTQFEKLLGRKIPEGKLSPKGEFTSSTCLEEMKDTLIGKIFISVVKKNMGSLADDNADEGMKRMAENMVLSMPLRAMTMTGSMTHEQVEGIVTIANGHFFKGLKMMK